ncbi:MAG: hypothetical protein GY754_37150 [bacterium]|nr:hypothetical protein [bacterium]
MMENVSDFTMYSGGHKGAEAEFGIQAEKYGVNEVNFSFEGHKMERANGMCMLSPEQLAEGDVSMEIVSMKMKRNFSQVDQIRKVIQSIFHMVNKGFQVFAIGWIQEDNTVKGGTGWGVELAKLFNRPVSVYDQDRKAWFTWADNAWGEDTPVIEHKTFCGSGTRNLSDDAKSAIGDLFDRSFGSK